MRLSACDLMTSHALKDEEPQVDSSLTTQASGLGKRSLVRVKVQVNRMNVSWVCLH